MNLEALLIVGGFMLAIGAALGAVAFLVLRLLQRRAKPSNQIRVTTLGFAFGVVQVIVTFAVVGIGFFQPNTFLGQVVAHTGGVPAIIILVSLICYPICAALQRGGFLLFYRPQRGG